MGVCESGHRSASKQPWLLERRRDYFKVEAEDENLRCFSGVETEIRTKSLKLGCNCQGKSDQKLP
jgi:hypothetical protein